MFSRRFRDPVWTALRKSTIKSFTSQSLRQALPEIVSSSLKVVENVRGKGAGAALDVDAIAARLTMEVIGKFGFKKDFGSAGSDDKLAVLEDMSDVMEELYHGITQPLRSYFFWSKEIRRMRDRFRRWSAHMRKLTQDVLASGDPEPDDNSVQANLRRLVHPETGKALTPRQLADEFVLWFIAGVETTAHTLAFTLFLMSQHPAETDAVIAELNSLGLLASPSRPHPRRLEWEDISKLKVLNAFIRETLRLMPVAPRVVRSAPQDVLLGDLFVPAGTLLHVPIRDINCSTANFKQGDRLVLDVGLRVGQHELDVEEEVQQAVKSSEPPSAGPTAGEDQPLQANGHDAKAVDAAANGVAASQLPQKIMTFSHGPRQCAGMALAHLELTAVLATLLAHFDWQLAEEMNTAEQVRRSLKIKITVQPTNGLYMKAVPRC